jgi:hypothetical protein
MKIVSLAMLSILENEISSENLEKIVLNEDEFNNYKEQGYFDELSFEWSVSNGVYSVIMSPQDYQLFYRKIQGNSNFL